MQTKKSFDTWYYIAISATFCVSFSSKSKRTKNKFWNRKQVINQFKQGKFFLWRVVKNYLCNILCKFLIKIECTMETRNQKKEIPADSHCVKFRNIHRKHLCWTLFFKKNAGLKACNFIKKRSKHRCFPVIFAKFLRIPILKNIYETAAFWPKGSKSRLHDCVRLPGPSHRSSFLFLSRYLVLNWVPTCVRKPKTNAFDESNKFLHWLLLVALGGFRSI